MKLKIRIKDKPPLTHCQWWFIISAHRIKVIGMDMDMMFEISQYWDGENWLKKVNQKFKINYYLDDNLHRNDGPAYIYHDRVSDTTIEKFYHHGKKHRYNGPAKIKTNTHGFKVYEYYFNGIEFNPDDLPFEMPINSPEKEFMFHLKYGV